MITYTAHPDPNGEWSALIAHLTETLKREERVGVRGITHAALYKAIRRRGLSWNLAQDGDRIIVSK